MLEPNAAACVKKSAFVNFPRAGIRGYFIEG